MPYDRELADRLRAVLGGWDERHDGADEAEDLGIVDEKPMFGGLGFMVAGHLAVCASSHGGLLVRVDPSDQDALVAADGVEPMRMAGRPSRSWVEVSPDALADDEVLTTWVQRGVAAARIAPRR
ncbi:TfoX/Sxy family protein [Microlunatus flavus]|uniref:TfoX N-terminal domain-containing protein n=1 Tax=Microlunatus flavus TaxID=1036181 RepID=A0A1H9CH09_9ACTN|nr:TfoX/Sxy family protein [Microlunatus flavus]SEQ00472.1 TfoX N-terminal domain-containing protein [Microlunatus flavus]